MTDYLGEIACSFKGTRKSKDSMQLSRCKPRCRDAKASAALPPKGRTQNSRLVPVSLRSPSARVGGAERDRTADLLRARQALSQLSYGPSAVLNLRRWFPGYALSFSTVCVAYPLAEERDPILKKRSGGPTWNRTTDLIVISDAL